MSEYVLHRELWLPRPRTEIFTFFSDAANLEALTPPWVEFHIATPRPIAINAGALIDYRLRVRGLPVRWQSEITVWEPPLRFVDEQRRGPYRTWKHEHRFEEKDGETLVIDDVRYSVPGGWLVHKLFVAPDLRRIFDFRERKMLELFGPKR